MMSALPLLAAMCSPVAPLAVRLAWSAPAGLPEVKEGDTRGLVAQWGYALLARRASRLSESCLLKVKLCHCVPWLCTNLPQEFHAQYAALLQLLAYSPSHRLEEDDNAPKQLALPPSAQLLVPKLCAVPTALNPLPAASKSFTIALLPGPAFFHSCC